MASSLPSFRWNGGWEPDASRPPDASRQPDASSLPPASHASSGEPHLTTESRVIQADLSLISKVLAKLSLSTKERAAWKSIQALATT
jgi:hypothetical protein